MSTTLAVLALAAASSTGLLVAAEDLAALLKDPAAVVVHVGDRPADFERAHIPGARFVHYRQIAVDGDGLQSELPPVDDLRRVLSSAGIGTDSKVIVYGSPMAATRLFFTLDYLGHRHVRVLNGGLNAWQAAGGAVASGPARPPAIATLITTPQPDRVVTAEWIRQRLSSPRMTLLDARPDAEFTGADGGMNGRHVAGHLPGARQLVWSTLLDASGRFLPDAELRKRFDAIGATAGTPLVSYCMVGMRASVTYFVARHLGYDARLYDGSIVDWTRRNLPTVKGQ